MKGKILYYNGTILTLRDKTDRPEAVLVEDGIIAGIGKLSDFDSVKRAERTDLDGCCLMPAFIDGHSHITMNVLFADAVHLDGCGNFGDIIATLKHALAQRKKTGKLLLGVAYDHNFLAEGRHPDKSILDRVSAEIPIIILHVSGHMGCVNSKVLSNCGITAETPDPKGGVIGRVGATAEPNGYLEEKGMLPVQKLLLSGAGLNPVSIAKRMQQSYIKNGITTAQDGASQQKGIAMLSKAGALGLLNIDIVAYPVLPSDTDMFARFTKHDRKYHNHLKLGGYKIILDGSPQGRSAWMSEPYLGGEPGYRAYPYMNDSEVENLIKKALTEKQQVLAHCNGDAASEQFITAYEKALEQSGEKGDYRPTMIHCQTVRDDQLERMAAINMIASIFVGHVYYWGDIHIKNFGADRGNRVSPVNAAQEYKVKFNFHQDTPVTRPDMLHSVWCAVNRISRSGQHIGPDQAIGVFEALRAVTANAAYQYFEEDSKGTIEVGKRADLIILDQNPLAAEPMDIKDIQVLKTIKDGKAIYCK